MEHRAPMTVWLRWVAWACLNLLTMSGPLGCRMRPRSAAHESATTTRPSGIPSNEPDPRIASTVTPGRAGLNERDPRVVRAQRAIFNHLAHSLEFRIDRALTRADRRSAQEAFAEAAQAVEEGLHRARQDGDYAQRASTLRTIAFVQSEESKQPISFDTARHLMLVTVPAGAATWLLSDELWVAVRDASEGTNSALLLAEPDDLSEAELPPYVRTLLKVAPPLGGSSAEERKEREARFRTERLLVVYPRITDRALRRDALDWLLRRGRHLIQESMLAQRGNRQVRASASREIESWFAWFNEQGRQLEDADRDDFIRLLFASSADVGPQVMKHFDAWSLVEPLLPAWLERWRSADERSQGRVLHGVARSVLCPEDDSRHCNGLLYDSLLVGPGGTPQRLATWLHEEKLPWLTRAALFGRSTRAGAKPTLDLVEQLLSMRSSQAPEALNAYGRSQLREPDAASARFLVERARSLWNRYRAERGPLLFALTATIHSTEGVARPEDIHAVVDGKIQQRELTEYASQGAPALSLLSALEPSLAPNVERSRAVLPALEKELDRARDGQDRQRPDELLQWVLPIFCRSREDFRAFERFLSKRAAVYPSLEQVYTYRRVTQQGPSELCPSLSRAQLESRGDRSGSSRERDRSRSKSTQHGNTRPSVQGKRDTILFGD